MAYTPYQDDDEDEFRPAGAAPAAASAPGAAAVAAPAQPQGGRFVGFSQYLNANRDAAQRTAGQVADGVEKQGQGAEGALRQAQGAFRQDVQRGAPGYSMPAAPSARATAAPRAQLQAGTPSMRPQGLYSQPSLEQQAQATYSGPGSLAEGSGYEALVGQTEKAAAAARNTGTSAGLQAVMAEQGRAASTSGGRAFDAGLVGATGQGRFAQVRSRYSGLSQLLTDANKESETLAGDAKAGVDTAAAGARDTLAKQKADDDARAKQDEARRAKEAEEDALLDRVLLDFQGNEANMEAGMYTPEFKRLFEGTYGTGSWVRFVAAHQRRKGATAGGESGTATRRGPGLSSGGG